MAEQAKAALEVEELDVVADRGHFDSEEILACDEAEISVTLLIGGSAADFRASGV